MPELKRIDFKNRLEAGRPVRATFCNELNNDVEVIVTDRYDDANVYIRYCNNINSIVPLDRLSIHDDSLHPKGRRGAAASQR